jgi:hypothetical protein
MQALEADQGRSAPFGYACHRCMRCCHHKRIQINPYEVARPARALGQSTTAFRATWTEDGEGVFLRRIESGACVFLGADWCTMHRDRPLACRLYPLAWRIGKGGAETWSLQTPHPESEGDYSNTGAISDYIEAQEARPYMRAYVDYLEWVRFARDRLDVAQDDTSAPSFADDFEILDMDTAIDRHAHMGASPPSDIEARTRLHLKILYDCVTSYMRGEL